MRNQGGNAKNQCGIAGKGIRVRMRGIGVGMREIE